MSEYLANALLPTKLLCKRFQRELHINCLPMQAVRTTYLDYLYATKTLKKTEKNKTSIKVFLTFINNLLPFFFSVVVIITMFYQIISINVVKFQFYNIILCRGTNRLLYLCLCNRYIFHYIFTAFIMLEWVPHR